LGEKINNLLLNEVEKQSRNIITINNNYHHADQGGVINTGGLGSQSERIMMGGVHHSVEKGNQFNAPINSTEMDFSQEKTITYQEIPPK
jgi:hypothetical protein